MLNLLREIAKFVLFNVFLNSFFLLLTICRHIPIYYSMQRDYTSKVLMHLYHFQRVFAMSCLCFAIDETAVNYKLEDMTKKNG